jgi:predicted transcriptional regulator
MVQADLFGEQSSKRYQYKRDDVIVLSFQPYAYEKIKSDSKRMEYRTRFRKRPTIAVIYVSSPIKEIRGIMFMGMPIIDTPDKIGQIAEKHIKGNGSSVYEYLKERKQAYAIPIEDYIEMPYLPLSQLRLDYKFIPPQSYVGLRLFPEREKHILNLIGSIDSSIEISYYYR